MTKDLIIWGGTGQAKVLSELIIGQSFRLVAIIDNRQIISPVPGILVLKGSLGLNEWLANRQNKNPLTAAVAIGGNKGADRLEIMNFFENLGIEVATLKHRTAFIAEDSSIGSGSQILANTSICTHVRLGKGVIVNTSASVDHDCIIKDGAHIGPGAKLAGEIVVGSRVFIGTGAVILPHLSIGDDAIVGAGAVVLRDVEPGAIVVGNPARPI
jgi:sugar O-acyltransferase (sialic acid O-acetyltransferase NeuD family)